MLELIVRTIAHLVSKDKSEQAEHKLDAYLDEKFKVRYNFVFKTVGIIVLLFFILWIISKLTYN